MTRVVRRITISRTAEQAVAAGSLAKLVDVPVQRASPCSVKLQ